MRNKAESPASLEKVPAEQKIHAAELAAPESGQAVNVVQPISFKVAHSRPQTYVHKMRNNHRARIVQPSISIELRGPMSAIILQTCFDL